MRIFTYIVYFWLPDPEVFNINKHYYLGLVEAPKRQIALEKAKEKWGAKYPDHEFWAFTKTGGVHWVYNKCVMEWLQTGNQGFFRPKSSSKK